MAKPKPTPEQLAARTIEPDTVPPIGEEATARAADDATVAAFASEMEEPQAVGALASTINEGFDVPRSPVESVIEKADRVLAKATDGGPHSLPHPRDDVRRPAAPVRRNYADEVYASEGVDDGEHVLDLMTANVAAMRMIEPVEPGWWREFADGGGLVERGKDVNGDPIMVRTGQIAYEAFMHEPVVIRVHSTRDKNESPLCYVGVNGDQRWLPRNKNVRIPRKLVERLAQAQEMSFDTKESRDPAVDQVMQVIRQTAASYEFSVLHDPNPLGRRWLRRVTREGS